MYASILALIVFIIFMLYVGWLFLADVLVILWNAVIIYPILLRVYTEIKENKLPLYMMCASVCLVLYYFTGNLFEGINVWGFTTYMILVFALAQLILWNNRVGKRYRKKKK